jgi:serine/threonine protein phosphatase PrpC
MSNSGQNVRASISKEVSTSQNQHTVQPRQTSKKFDNCVTKFAFATKTGYSPKNPNKINQDSFLVLPHLGEYRRTHFFAVADGHGVNGKLVSEFVKTMLAKEVEQSIKYTFDQAKINQRVVDSTEVKEQLDKSFNRVTDQLFKNSGINLRFSGSTCVSVLIVGNKVFCANVGDSRATLARRKEIPGSPGQFKMIGIPLNRDHKADEPDEQ